MLSCSLPGNRKNNSRTALTLGPIGYWRHLTHCQALAVPEKNGGERRASVKRVVGIPGYPTEGLAHVFTYFTTNFIS